MISMPSANAKAKRKQQRAQAQKSAQRGARDQCAAAGTDQQWIDNEIVAVRELEMQLERKRGLIAQAQQELDLRQQHAQVSSVRTARSTSQNARNTSQDAIGGAQARTKTSRGSARSTRGSGRHQKDSTAGQTMNAPDLRGTTQGKCQNDSHRAGQTTEAAQQRRQQREDTGTQQHQQQPYSTAAASQQHQRTHADISTRVYTKAMEELLDALGMEQPPVEPTARKLFEAEVLTKAKRIFKTQKQRETRRRKSRYYKTQHQTQQ